MKRLARLLAYLSLLNYALIAARVRTPLMTALYTPKLLVTALAPLWGLFGGLAALIGLLRRDRRALLLGLLGAGLTARYIRQVSAPHDGFERAFGADWKAALTPAQANKLLPQRWTPWLSVPAGARFEQNIPFWTVPGSGRELLCDLWQPPDGVRPSGLALIYFHGSAWHYLDKDYQTRPFFRYLANQGHVVMDVAYRLCPEGNIYDMVGDAKRAVAWMKDNAARLGVSPAKVVLAGGSAGAQLALLAAYAPNLPALTPDDLRDVDTSVRGVISYYGPTNMHMTYADARVLTDRSKPGGQLADVLVTHSWRLVGMLKPDQRILSIDTMMTNLLGGLPGNGAHDTYTLASPITHVHPDCPPTLLLQGAHDWMVNPVMVRDLYRALTECGVKAVYVEFPQNDHAFDLGSLPFSPSTQAALYDVERFLALLM